MASFLKFICPLEVSDARIASWYKDPFDTFVNAPIGEQLKFLYGQAISINYLNRVYDHDLPYFISLMRNEFIDIFFPCFKESINFIKDPADKFLVRQHFEMIKYLFGGQQYEQYDKAFLTKFDIREIISILQDLRYPNTPVPCTMIFYESYLMFLQEVFNRAFGLTTATSFHVNGLIALPQFTINNCLLIEHDVVVSESYNYSYEDNQRFGTNPLSLGVNSIFAFWRGYNWRHLSYDSVVSILATYGALEVHCTSDNSLKRAYYDVYQLMNPMSTSADLKPCICHNAVLNFLVDIFRRFNTKAVDKVMMDKLFFASTAQTANVHEIATKKLREEMDSLFGEVAEANEAFKSTLRNLGIGKMSSGSLPMFVEDANLVSKLLFDAGGNKKEEDQNDDPNNPDQDKKKDSKEKKDPESPDENQEGENTPPEDNPEATTDQKEEQPNQETTPSLDQEGKNPEEEEPASVDANSNDETNKDTENKGDEEQTQTHTGSHTTLPKPRIPGMSLKRGIKLELANDDETIDSFLYRKEVGSFIDDIVSNPNHDFSVQQIQAFKIIKSRLLWTLNVQSLYNLLKEISKA